MLWPECRTNWARAEAGVRSGTLTLLRRKKTNNHRWQLVSHSDHLHFYAVLWDEKKYKNKSCLYFHKLIIIQTYWVISFETLLLSGSVAQTWAADRHRERRTRGEVQMREGGAYGGRSERGGGPGVHVFLTRRLQRIQRNPGALDDDVMDLITPPPEEVEKRERLFRVWHDQHHFSFQVFWYLQLRLPALIFFLQSFGSSSV